MAVKECVMGAMNGVNEIKEWMDLVEEPKKQANSTSKVFILLAYLSTAVGMLFQLDPSCT